MSRPELPVSLCLSCFGVSGKRLGTLDACSTICLFNSAVGTVGGAMSIGEDNRLVDSRFVATGVS